VIIEVVPDVWRVPGADLKMPGGVKMPIAATVFRVSPRDLVVYSPVRFDDDTAAAIDRLGTVAHIVAPNRLHHMYASVAAARWPDAVVHAAPGLREKQPELKIDRELPAEIDPAFELELIAGAPGISECVMFHRPSSTLACADLVFNVTQPANARTRFALAIMGAGGRTLRMSRFWRLARKDKDAIRASLDRVLAWPIARVVPCHGEVAELTSAELAPRLARGYGGTPGA
jgi:hypothetical protein